MMGRIWDEVLAMVAVTIEFMVEIVVTVATYAAMMAIGWILIVWLIE